MGLIVLSTALLCIIPSQNTHKLTPLAKPEFQRLTDVALPQCTGKVVIQWRACEGVTHAYMEDVAVGVRGRLIRCGVPMVRSGTLDDWLDAHPQWDTPSEIADGCGAEWVISIDVHDEAVSVRVHDCWRRDSSMIYSAELPRGTAQQVVESVAKRLCPTMAQPDSE